MKSYPQIISVKVGVLSYSLFFLSIAILCYLSGSLVAHGYLDVRILLWYI